MDCENIKFSSELIVDESTDAGLTAQLIGLEGWRVEVEPLKGGRNRRFVVERTKDEKPIHLELSQRRSSIGRCADRAYKSVRKLYRVK
jgi:hypothetical protein